MTCDYCEIIDDGIFHDRCGKDEDYEIIVDAPDEYTGDIDSPYIFHSCEEHYKLKDTISWGMVKSNHEQLVELDQG